MYFLISCNDDGDVRVRSFHNQAELLDLIGANKKGEVFDAAEVFTEHDTVPMDPMEWGSMKYLIIKGGRVGLQPTFIHYTLP